MIGPVVRNYSIPLFFVKIYRCIRPLAPMWHDITCDVWSRTDKTFVTIPREPRCCSKCGVAEETITVPTHQRRRSHRKPLPDHLPRIDVEDDLSDQEKVCRCGCQLSRIGKELSEQLDIIPAKIQVIRHIRHKYACKDCEQTVRTAALPPQPIPKSNASPGLLAHITVAKYQDALPLARQEKPFARSGVTGLPYLSNCYCLPGRAGRPPMVG